MADAVAGAGRDAGGRDTSRAMNPAAIQHPPRGHAPQQEDDGTRKRFAAGDERALEECHNQFGPLLLAYARRYVGPNDAETVTVGNLSAETVTRNFRAIAAVSRVESLRLVRSFCVAVGRFVAAR